MKSPNQAGPKFLRSSQVRELYGLSRGTLHNLLARGLITGVLLKVTGAKSGVRLWDAPSIDALIAAQRAAGRREVA